MPDMNAQTCCDPHTGPCTYHRGVQDGMKAERAHWVAAVNRADRSYGTAEGVVTSIWSQSREWLADG